MPMVPEPPPFLPAVLLRWLVLPFLVMVAVMSAVGGPLVSPAAPHGIVSLELCAFTGSCAAILQDWTARQREVALLGLGLDFLYLALYPTVIASALLVLARRLGTKAWRTARALAWLMAAAGLADAVENHGLIHLLLTRQVDWHATTSAACATAKFTVLAVALVALLALSAWAAGTALASRTGRHPRRS